MNMFSLSFAYLRNNALSTCLNLLLLALGIATVTVLLLFSQQLEDRLSRDTRGVDLVVGAKGSPMQLILSSVFHIDTPTGNIPLQDARWVQEHPLVRGVIPLALGDSYRGHRIVGSEHSYVAHYGGRVGDGRLWNDHMEATLGARAAERTGLGVGDRFVGVHGITDGDPVPGEVHDDHPYTVVGVLAPTGTVLDRLILVSVESVWKVHDHAHEEHAEDHHEHEDGHDHAHAGDDNHEHDEHADEAREQHAHAHDDRELTALLVQYRSPLAAVSLPRVVNSRNALQAASPAMETARLLQLLGVGLDALRAFGWLLITAAGLGVFIALYNTLQQRRYDLALMRTLGASRWKLVSHVMLEGVLLAGLGALLGVGLGHVAAELLGGAFRQTQQLELTGWIFFPQELWLILLALVVGALAALIPAIQAYRTDIAQTLRQ